MFFSFGFDPIFEKRSDIAESRKTSSSIADKIEAVSDFCSRSNLIHPINEETGVPN